MLRYLNDAWTLPHEPAATAVQLDCRSCGAGGDAGGGAGQGSDAVRDYAQSGADGESQIWRVQAAEVLSVSARQYARSVYFLRRLAVLSAIPVYFKGHSITSH